MFCEVFCFGTMPKRSSDIKVEVGVSVRQIKEKYDAPILCYPKKWVSHAGCLSGKTEETRTLNNYPDAVEHLALRYT
jgi:hypothetical protein